MPAHISGENHNLKRCMHPSVHCSTIYNRKTWKQPKKPISREMDKEDVVCVYVEYYSVIKKNKMMSFAMTQMHPDIGIWSEVRERQMCYHSYVKS